MLRSPSVRLRVAASGALVLLALVAAASRPTVARPVPGDRAALVERGRLLTQVGACNDCHTPGFFYGDPDGARLLSGSELGWTGPWGTTFPRNLTPDLETGIGRWSEAEIVRTLRTGVRPDGSVLKPPMPWMNVATLGDDDLFAIAAYLKSLPAVRHRAPDALPPGVAYDGPTMRFPPPPAWDGAHLAARTPAE